MSHLSPDQADKILKADLAAIVAKVKAGKPLTAPERRAIREASGAPGTYLQTCEFYANRHGCDVRTIKRWRAAGAPLDDEAAMPAWIANLKNNGRSVASGASKKGGNSRTSGEVRLPRGEGLEAYIKRLTAAEKRLADLYAEAIEDGDPQSMKIYGAEWTSLGAELRTTERQLPDLRKASGAVVDAGEVRALMAKALGEFRGVLERAAARLQERLAGETDVHAIRKAVDEIHDEALEHIREVAEGRE